MNPLLLFLVSALFSFVGSLQLGPVNSQVLRRAIAGQRRAARLTSLGGALPEILYAALAAFLVNELHAYSQLKFWFRIVFIVLISALGLYLLLKKAKAYEMNRQSKWSKQSFLHGLILGLFNPQLIFFWSGILVYLGLGALDTSAILAFSFGAFAGAFLLLFGLSQLGKTLGRKRFFQEQKRVDKLIGSILLGVGLFELLRPLFT